MSALIMDDGLELMLKLLTNQDTTDDLYLHLFAAAHTPAATDDATVYAPIELGPGFGYAPFLFNATAWFLNVTSGVVSLLYPPIDFVFTSGPFTVYGFYVTHGMTGLVVFADELATPQAVDAMGNPPVSVSVQIQSKNCP